MEFSMAMATALIFRATRIQRHLRGSRHGDDESESGDNLQIFFHRNLIDLGSQIPAFF